MTTASTLLEPLWGRQGLSFDLGITENELVYDIGPYSTVRVQAVGNTAWASGAFTVYVSNDGANPYEPDEGPQVIGPGSGKTEELSALRENRLHVKVTTPAAGVSAKIIVHGKTNT